MAISVDNSTGTVVRGDKQTRTVTIDSDLSDKEYYFVDFDATDSDVVNLVEDSATPGFILEKAGDGSSTTLYDGVVVLSGDTKVKLGGTVATGDRLTATTGGAAIVTTTDKQNYNCIAMQEGSSGDLIDVHVERGLISAS